MLIGRGFAPKRGIGGSLRAVVGAIGSGRADNLAIVRATALLVAGLVAVLAAAGCGDEDEFTGSPDPATERNDQPAKPPPGWRTFANATRGLHALDPGLGWPARSREDRDADPLGRPLLAITVAADRSEAGRDHAPAALRAAGVPRAARLPTSR